jgi:DNA-binding winged helix-turn-helix (wHTH) protein
MSLEPKAFRALLFLLHNPQRLISKEELLNSVWGDATVTEGSLTRCIWLLRSVLGDDIRSPRYIETVATVGYRFICPVEVSEDVSGEPEATEAPKDLSGAGKKAVRRRRLWDWAQAGGVLALCLAGTIWYLHRPLQPPRITGYTQITHDGQQKVLVGTDGNKLYFNQAKWDSGSSGQSLRLQSRAERLQRSRLRCRNHFCTTFRRMVPASSLVRRDSLLSAILECSDPWRLHSPPRGCRLRGLFARRELRSLLREWRGRGQRRGRHLRRAKRWDGSPQTGFGWRLGPRYRLVPRQYSNLGRVWTVSAACGTYHTS